MRLIRHKTLKNLHRRIRQLEDLWGKTDYSRCFGTYGSKCVTCQGCDYKEYCIKKQKKGW